MAGPYATIRLAPDLFADVRTAWGRSDNTVTPLGTYTDSFDTSRSLYSASLIGRFKIDERTQVQPEVSLRYLRDEQESYVDSFDIYIPSQTVDQGELSFRPRLQRAWELSDGWTMLSFGTVEGVYTFGAPGDSALSEEFRVRVEGGADLISVFGVRASVSGFYDGLGVDGYENLGLRLSLSTGF
jgi:hypothetical protein